MFINFDVNFCYWWCLFIYENEKEKDIGKKTNKEKRRKTFNKKKKEKIERRIIFFKIFYLVSNIIRKCNDKKLKTLESITKIFTLNSKFNQVSII